MSAGNWVALAGIILTCFIAAVSLAVRYVNGQIDSRVKDGDSRLAHSIDLLRVSMEAISDRLLRSESEHADKLDAVVHEITSMNDGSTVKAAVHRIEQRVTEHDSRIDRLEGHHQ